MRNVNYDTGIWYFYPDSRMLLFRGMLGERHKLKRDAVELIRTQTASDVVEGTVADMKNKGKVILYFLSRLEHHENSVLINMTTYVSETYGEEIIAILKDYDNYQKINLKVI